MRDCGEAEALMALAHSLTEARPEMKATEHEVEALIPEASAMAIGATLLTNQPISPPITSEGNAHQRETPPVTSSLSAI